MHVPREIPIGFGLTVLVDARDYPILACLRWELKTHTVKAYAQAAIPTLGRIEAMHRILTECPKGMYVDHINGDGLDNRRANLRIVTPAENQANRIRWGKVKDIVPAEGGWSAFLTVGSIRRKLGNFDSLQEAVIRYQHAKRSENLRRESTKRPGGRLYAGRPSKVWFRRDRNAWASRIEGRLLTLAHGEENMAEAVHRLASILTERGISLCRMDKSMLPYLDGWQATE